MPFYAWSAQTNKKKKIQRQPLLFILWIVSYWFKVWFGLDKGTKHQNISLYNVLPLFRCLVRYRIGDKESVKNSLPVKGEFSLPTVARCLLIVGRLIIKVFFAILLGLYLTIQYEGLSGNWCYTNKTEVKRRNLQRITDSPLIPMVTDISSPNSIR